MHVAHFSYALPHIKNFYLFAVYSHLLVDPKRGLYRSILCQLSESSDRHADFAAFFLLLHDHVRLCPVDHACCFHDRDHACHGAFSWF